MKTQFTNFHVREQTMIMQMRSEYVHRRYK